MAPIIDPVAAVVCAADISNVRDVLVDGVFRKRDFRLVQDLDSARQDVLRSRDWLVQQVPAEATWITTPMAS